MTCTCTFDLINADSNDYQNAYEALSKIGLHRKTNPYNGEGTKLPSTMTIGKFNGSSYSDLRDDITKKVKTSFKNLSLKSKVFITVSDHCTSAYLTT